MCSAAACVRFRRAAGHIDELQMLTRLHSLMSICILCSPGDDSTRCACEDVARARILSYSPCGDALPPDGCRSEAHEPIKAPGSYAIHLHGSCTSFFFFFLVMCSCVWRGDDKCVADHSLILLYFQSVGVGGGVFHADDLGSFMDGIEAHYP